MTFITDNLEKLIKPVGVSEDAINGTMIPRGDGQYSHEMDKSIVNATGQKSYVLHES